MGRLRAIAFAAAILAVVVPAGAAETIGADLRAKMLAAAETMRTASRVLLAEKRALGLFPGDGVDPNRTGMVGVEYNEMTTAVGELGEKRSTTNPDFAAAYVRYIAGLDLPKGSAVVLVLSGSYVGGDVALLAALEALGHRIVLIASAGTSQYGANDPEFNLFEILALIERKGIVRSRPVAAVLGGTNANGGGIDRVSFRKLTESAERAGYPLMPGPGVSASVDQLIAAARTALAGERPSLVVNVGASIVGLGECLESFTFPTGFSRSAMSCTSGPAGILMKLGAEGIPTLHVLNIKQVTRELGLPFDPIPLPAPGDNRAVYGS
ncbi:MAG: poly-gamma-glutamate system protein [Bauldia sp.]